MPNLNQEPSYEELKSICHGLEYQIDRLARAEQVSVHKHRILEREISRLKIIHSFNEEALKLDNALDLGQLSVETAIRLYGADCGFILDVAALEGPAAEVRAQYGFRSLSNEIVYDPKWLDAHAGTLVLGRAEISEYWPQESGFCHLMIRPLFKRNRTASKLLCIGRHTECTEELDSFESEVAPSFEILARQIESHYQKFDAQATMKRQLEELKELDKVKDQANRMKDEFLATLSHELRTPLSVIQGHIEILMQEPDCMKSEAIANSLEAVVRNTQSQTQIINDLLDVSRIVTGKLSFHPRLVNPREIVEAAVKSLSSNALSKGVQIRHTYDPLAPNQIFADATRLQQIIWNLISNAIKFTPENGRIDIECKRKDGSFSISVKDSGQGIEPAFLPYVFERFKQEDSSSTRKFGGLGLGLSIVRHLCELHGGGIYAHSDGKGKGSEFTVILPVEMSKEVLKNSDGEKAEDHLIIDASLRLDGMKVLLVDDSDDNRNLIAMVLSRVGAIVEPANSARQARDKMARFQPDIIVSDIGMPEEDGVMFMKQLRSEQQNPYCKIPSVALTAYARSDEIQQILEAGFQTHVSKPVSRAHLIQSLHQLVHSAH